LGFFSSLGEEIFSLYYLNSKDKIIITPILQGEEVYLPLKLISSLLQTTLKIENKNIFLLKGEKEVLFKGTIGNKEAIIRDKKLNLLEPVMAKEDDIYIPAKSFFSFLGYRLIIKEKNIYILQILEQILESNDKIFIKFRTQDVPSFSFFTLKDPNRLVIDIRDCIVIEKKEQISKISGIKQIRYSQFSTEPYVVRVVIEFTKGVLDYKISQAKGELVVDFFNYKETIKDEKKVGSLLNINWSKNNDKLIFDIYFDSSFTYIKGNLKEPERIYYDFFPNFKNTLTDTIVVNEGPVEKIRIGILNNETKNLRIVFDVYTSTVAEEESFTNTLRVSFPIQESSEKTEENFRNKFVIFIDPGHGGTDPGAIYSNIQEKDLNLKISLKLADTLKKAGYNVVLLRDKDVTVTLDERVNIVKDYLNSNNNSNQEKFLFISIHSNAALSPEIKGIELYYATDFSLPFAQTIYRVLSRYYNVRNMRQGRFYVLSRIPIPGIIIETGFLSNDDERKLLTTEEYQNNLVEKIQEAIEEWVKSLGS